MTGDTVYNAVLTWIRKDSRGLSLTPDEFNTMTPLINRRIQAHYAKDFEKDIENTTSIGFLKVLNYSLALTSGVASLPTNYYQHMGDPYYYDADGIRRNVDIVTSLENSFREVDYLTKSTSKYPTCVIGGQDGSGVMQISVYPTTLTTIYLNYLRDADTPFLDYYINNSTKVITYLTEGQTTTLTSAYTYRTGTSGAITSSTVDWEWSYDDLPLIIAYFLSALGGIIPDELLTQIATLDKADISR